MAEIIINDKIEFAYVLNDTLAELIKELENRFLYQKILVLDGKYELSDEIDFLIKKVKCEFLVKKDIDDVFQLEDIACVIVVNCHNLQSVKKTCAKLNKPYIVALTKIYDTSVLNSQIIDIDKQIVQCRYPLGVVLFKQKIYNKKDFVCKFMLEFVNFMFDNMQTKIDNLFFFNSSAFSVFKQDNLLESIKNTVFKKNNEELFNQITKLYLLLCIKKSSKPLSLLDRVTELSENYLIDVKHKIEAKYLFQCVLCAITKNFFVLWSKKLKSTLDIKKHQTYIQKYNLKCDFKASLLQEQKIEFLLDEFREKLIDYTDEQLTLTEKIKDIIADINVDFLYNVFNLKFKNPLTDFICLEPDLYDKNSILKILSANGLLNFDF